MTLARPPFQGEVVFVELNEGQCAKPLPLATFCRASGAG